MADVKDPYSYHRQSNSPDQPIRLKINLKSSRKLVKDNFGRRSNSPKKILPGSRDHVAQILTPNEKLTAEVTKVGFSASLIGCYYISTANQRPEMCIEFLLKFF